MTAQPTIDGVPIRPLSRRGVPVRVIGVGFSPNVVANREAVKRLTEAERLCGFTVQELDERHAQQRERVRARYGL